MISVIIPAYNEEEALPTTLRHLLKMSGRYEVLVVDGGSRDSTVQVASQDRRVQVVSAPKGRASQMRGRNRRKENGCCFCTQTPISQKMP